jgi:hypothetical protein
MAFCSGYRTEQPHRAVCEDASDVWLAYNPAHRHTKRLAQSCGENHSPSRDCRRRALDCGSRPATHVFERAVRRIDQTQESHKTVNHAFVDVCRSSDARGPQPIGVCDVVGPQNVVNGDECRW